MAHSDLVTISSNRLVTGLLASSSTRLIRSWNLFKKSHLRVRSEEIAVRRLVSIYLILQVDELNISSVELIIYPHVLFMTFRQGFMASLSSSFNHRNMIG